MNQFLPSVTTCLWGGGQKERRFWREAQAGPPDSERPMRGQDEAAGNGGGGPEQC